MLSIVARFQATMGPELQIQLDAESGCTALWGRGGNFFGTGHLGNQNTDFIKDDQRACHQRLGENIRRGQNRSTNEDYHQ